MSLAAYKPRSRLFSDARNWRAALAWVERKKRERLRELADCGGTGAQGGLRDVPARVEGPTAPLPVRGGTGKRAAQVRRVFAGEAGQAGVLAGIR